MNTLHNVFALTIISLLAIAPIQGMKRQAGDEQNHESKRMCVPVKNLKRIQPDSGFVEEQGDDKKLHKYLKRPLQDGEQQASSTQSCTGYGIQTLSIPVVDFCPVTNCSLGLEHLQLKDVFVPQQETVNILCFQNYKKILDVPVLVLRHSSALREQLKDLKIYNLNVFDVSSDTMEAILLFLNAIDQEFPYGTADVGPDAIAYALQYVNQTTGTWLKDHGFYGEFMACWDGAEKLDMPFLMEIFNRMYMHNTHNNH